MISVKLKKKKKHNKMSSFTLDNVTLLRCVYVKGCLENSSLMMHFAAFSYDHNL